MSDLILCANIFCFNEFESKLVYRKSEGKRRPKIYCSRGCAGRAYNNLEKSKRASRIAADLRRGSNPNDHIRIRIDGQRWMLHRRIVYEERGQLARDSVVHHRDENKHHNCYGSRLCESCAEKNLVFIAFIEADLFWPILTSIWLNNLEILTDDAAREHIKYHQQKMQSRRRAKRK